MLVGCAGRLDYMVKRNTAFQREFCAGRCAGLIANKCSLRNALLNVMAKSLASVFDFT